MTRLCLPNERTWIAATLAALAILLAAGPEAAPAASPAVKLERGDRITLIGNALPERMQHFGHFETLVQARFPEKELRFRNLGYAGDELDVRLRVKGYGSQDEWLKRTDTDVIFAFFGFNESFAGKDGLDDFRNQLKNFIEHVRSRKYNGESKPELVLFSPIAHEDLNDPDLPSGERNNERLKMYTGAMSEIADQRDVPFIDLFTTSKKLYAQSEKPLTINGVHMNERGYAELAPRMDTALFGPRRGPLDTEHAATLRKAVKKKNFCWFERYRVSDGYNVYGGRSKLTYRQGKPGDGDGGGDPEGLSNREVMKREMRILEVMTANRDERIWKIARGGGWYEVDDSNTPEFIEVKTNKPGDLPGGKHKFLGGKEAIEKMKVHPEMQVNLFASEEQFPELVNPVQMAFDTKGRLWVAAWHTYPHWKPKTEMDDKLLILEDTDGDGRADERTVFADGLSNPTGFEFYNGGVLVARAPYILFLKDTDGDNKADVKRRLLSSISSGDTHHTANSFVVGPGGAVYFQEGIFHRTQIETPHGPVRSKDSTIWRFRPDTFEVQRYAPHSGFANPHGHVFTKWGQGISHDGTSARPYHDTLISGRLPFPQQHYNAPRLYNKRTRPCPATGLLSSRHFPDDFQGNLLVQNVIGFQGILQYELSHRGSSLRGKEVKPILRSTDENFRPVDLQIGPRGAMFLTDWQNPIIGHMQHHIRDPNRDSKHGRVYRVTHKSRDLAEPVKIAGQPIEHLVGLLESPSRQVRYRAKIELSERDSDRVLAAVEGWLGRQDADAADYERRRLQALWMHQYHNRVNEPLLREVLESPSYPARAAAVRVLGYWRGRVASPLKLLEQRVNDRHPHVRLAAVRALSFFRSARAAEIALQAARHEMDEYLDYTLGETLRALAPQWKAALRAGEPFAEGNPDGLGFLLDRVGPKELVNLPREPAVAEALLRRQQIPAPARRDALRVLAEDGGTSPFAVLLDTLRAVQNTRVLEDLAGLLVGWDRSKLAAEAQRLEKMARSADQPIPRQAAYAALVRADGDAERAWKLASESLSGVHDFLGAVPRLQDAKLSTSLYPRVAELARSLPSHLSSDGGAGAQQSEPLLVEVYQSRPKNAAKERFKPMKPAATVRVSRITLDVPHRPDQNYGLRFTGSLHVPRDGTYRFWTESDDGSRLYVNGKQVVDNDGYHGPRQRSGQVELEKGTHRITVTHFQGSGGQALKAFWSGPGFGKQQIPMTALGTHPADAVRRRAIRVLGAMPVDPQRRFEALAALIEGGRYVGEAVEAIRAIDAEHWPEGRIEPVARAIVEHGRSLPASRRSGPAFRKALEFGRALADRLPDESAKRINDALDALVVQVIEIAAVEGKLLYDMEHFTVTAGKPVKIVMRNPDKMPHNLIVAKPGQMKAVGLAAEKMATEPGAFAKGFVPDHPAVMHHTKMLQPGQSDAIQFTAPEKPDEYPYLCTFPGHFRTMNGIMEVVPAR